MKKFFLLFLLMLVLLIQTYQAKELLDDSTVIGKIDGKVVKFKDLKDLEIQKLIEELHRLVQINFQTKAANEFIKKEKILISEKQIKEFYENNELSKRGSYNELKTLIIKYLKEYQQAKKQEEDYKKLVKKGRVQFSLEEPSKILVKAAIGTAFVRGNKKAKVMLLEFSDYQCPFCKKNQSVINSLISKYKKKVAFAYRHFPLSFHKEADEAAIAVECAREQGKFLALHNLIFANTQKLQPQDLKDYAIQVGIKNNNQFNSCLDARKYQNQVDRDIAVALKTGITSTPSYIIGKVVEKKFLQGEIVVGALSREQLETVILRYL